MSGQYWVITNPNRDGYLRDVTFFGFVMEWTNDLRRCFRFFDPNTANRVAQALRVSGYLVEMKVSPDSVPD